MELLKKAFLLLAVLLGPDRSQSETCNSDECHPDLSHLLFDGTIYEIATFAMRGDHAEAVVIHYDPSITSYEEMLKIFWEIHDPTKPPSKQYMSAIFYHTDQQREVAEQSIKQHQKLLSRKILTKIVPASVIYNAEDYHQKHYLRIQPDILQELKLSDQELLNSNLAARLNGYCGGYGTLKEFERDALSFNISLAAQERVRELITKGPGTDDD